jgi:predicted RNase H-like HicB family nuclease
MKKLKVVVCKADRGVSAHLPDVEGYIVARDTFELLKRDLPEGLRFHIEGLYPEERRDWMNDVFEFEFKFLDVPSFIEAHQRFLNQSSLARIVGINEGQMRQYAAGVKHPTRKTLERMEAGIKQYASELQSFSFV